MFKGNTRDIKTRCEICSKLKIKTAERRHWHRSHVFINIFEQISRIVLVLPNIYDPAISAKKGDLFSRKIFIVDVDPKYVYIITC